ncbi:hypothetical protein [Bradyrhizobium yuanmingense]|uniref:hypothetical protein n=1 Tax=Bradyrhizobium yuanmingense TaxID=108015 RepID=UPI0023B9D59E|nr:hypothetical protein [Bradyrhizobium yuanmingense]MDF0584916.1 hypothetical protein [Bradyrhizobium yuanmingense]
MLEKILEGQNARNVKLYDLQMDNDGYQRTKIVNQRQSLYEPSLAIRIPLRRTITHALICIRAQ